MGIVISLSRMVESTNPVTENAGSEK